MADQRWPQENLPRERLPGYQDGRPRAPVNRAPQFHPRQQSPNHEDHLNPGKIPDRALNFAIHNIPYRPNLPDRGHRVDHHIVHHHDPNKQTSKSRAGTRQLYHLQPDDRLPTTGSYPSTPISLSSPDGFVTHLLLLLPPSSRILSALLADAKKAREPTSYIPAEDVVERALENRTLMHVSDGPSGGIWVVAAEKPEILACLVAEMQGGWEILGVGQGGNEGMMFLRHPCGSGLESEEKEENKKKKTKNKEKKKTKWANVEENDWNREMGWDEGRAWDEERAWDEGRAWDEEGAWESEEDSDEGGVDFLGCGVNVRVHSGRDREGVQSRNRGRDRENVYYMERGGDREIVQNMERGRGREGAHNMNRGRDRETVQNANRGPNAEKVQSVERGPAVERGREREFSRDWTVDWNQEAERNRMRAFDQDDQIPAANVFRGLEDILRTGIDIMNIRENMDDDVVIFI